MARELERIDYIQKRSHVLDYISSTKHRAATVKKANLSSIRGRAIALGSVEPKCGFATVRVAHLVCVCGWHAPKNVGCTDVVPCTIAVILQQRLCCQVIPLRTRHPDCTRACSSMDYQMPV